MVKYNKIRPFFFGALFFGALFLAAGLVVSVIVVDGAERLSLFVGADFFLAAGLAVARGVCPVYHGQEGQISQREHRAKGAKEHNQRQSR